MQSSECIKHPYQGYRRYDGHMKTQEKGRPDFSPPNQSCSLHIPDSERFLNGRFFCHYRNNKTFHYLSPENAQREY